MKSNKKNFVIGICGLFMLSVVGCSPGMMSSSSSASASSIQAVVTPAHFAASTFSNVGSYTSNTMTIGVNDSSTCGTVIDTVNIPCVSVTLCSVSSPSTCTTINGILLDTGSYGLRVFKSAIASNVLSGFSPVTNGSNTLGECVHFGDGSEDWGQVEYAYVQLGGEPAVATPIQVIDPNFNAVPTECDSANGTLDTSPAMAGFNGILGVGLLAQDCGTECAISPYADGSSYRQYFTCLNGSCNGGAYVASGAQVVNPINLLPTDNNGVVVTLPSISAAGVASTTGTLTMGIGTRATVSSSVTVLATNSSLVFPTNSGSSYAAGTAVSGFLDTGSNGLFFAGALTSCSSGVFDGWFCPTSTTSLTYTNTSYTNHSSTSTVSISIANANSLHSTTPSAAVFSNLGAYSSGMFDFGLPFYFGRSVYVGINGMSATLNSGTSTGPYFAY